MTGTNHIIELPETPKGVDFPIQNIQNYLFSKLDWEDCNVYGRVSKVEGENGLLPKFFVSGSQYKDVFTDDRKTASIFFICDDLHKTKNGVLFSVGVKVVFMANIKKLFPQSTKRAEPEIQGQTLKAIKEQTIFKFEGEIETGIDQVFKGFDTSKIKNTDFGDYHVFSINGSVNYYFK